MIDGGGEEIQMILFFANYILHFAMAFNDPSLINNENRGE
jgi:hypothetical protein